jgi:hypothetical protein
MTSAGSGTPPSDMTITEHELQQCERANETGRQPVVFVHGLWLLPSSWDRWATVFEDSGYAALTPGWPDDPDTVEEAKAHPEVFAGKSVGHLAVLRYDDARAADDPRAGVLDFYESAYQAGARRAGWDIQRLASPGGITDPTLRRPRS